MVEEYQEMSVERLRTYMAQHEENEYLLVDVRQPDEYTKGHIPGAVLVPLGEVPERMGELPVDKDIILYCRSGKRSKGAAIFIGSRPYVAGTVFNLSGGLLAWDGHLLENFPNMRIFAPGDSDQQILLRAMDLERGAQRLYLALRQQYGDTAWKDNLAVLADAEEAHAWEIYRFWAERENDPPAFATLYGGLAGDLIEGGFSTNGLGGWLEKQPAVPNREVLEVALAIEYGAYDLYRNMAHRFLGHRMERVFNAIAEAEKEHMRLVARMLAA